MNAMKRNYISPRSEATLLRQSSALCAGSGSKGSLGVNYDNLVSGQIGD